jgi:hypothetical protein
MFVCALLSGAVWHFARDLDLYNDDDDVDGHEMADFPRRRDPKIISRRATPAAKRRKDDPVISGEDGVTLRSELEQMTQPEEQEFRFNLTDLSDHMEDSMEVSSPNRPLSLY